MSTLDTKSENQGFKTIIIYVYITIATLIFSTIYLDHSYGVYSNYMKYLSLIPAVGIIVSLVMYVLDKKILKSRAAYNLFNAAIFTLVIGSGLEGIFEICGAHSFYMWIYLLLGGLFMISSFVITTYINVKFIRNKKKEPKALKEKND